MKDISDEDIKNLREEIHEIKFTISKKDKEVLREKILPRAMRMAKEDNERYDEQDCEMDLTATHANGCPLDFEKLAGFNDFNFAHDLYGIRRHIDRSTGELTQCFFPRCARKDWVESDASS